MNNRNNSYDNYKSYNISNYIKNIKKKFNNTLEKQIEYFDRKNTMPMIYENNNPWIKISLLGEGFVNKYINNCVLLINNKEKKEYKYKFDQKKRKIY